MNRLIGGKDFTKGHYEQTNNIKEKVSQKATVNRLIIEEKSVPKSYYEQTIIFKKGVS